MDLGSKRHVKFYEEVQSNNKIYIYVVLHFSTITTYDKVHE